MKLSTIILFIISTTTLYAQTQPKPTGGRIDYQAEMASETILVDNFQLNLQLCDHNNRSVKSALEIQLILQEYLSGDHQGSDETTRSNCSSQSSNHNQAIIKCLLTTNSINQKAYDFAILPKANDYLVEIHNVSPGEAGSAIEYLKNLSSIKP